LPRRRRQRRDSALSAAKDGKPSTGCLAAIVVAVAAREPRALSFASKRAGENLLHGTRSKERLFSVGNHPPSLARSLALPPSRGDARSSRRVCTVPAVGSDRQRGRRSAAVSGTDTEGFLRGTRRLSPPPLRPHIFSLQRAGRHVGPRAGGIETGLLRYCRLLRPDGQSSRDRHRLSGSLFSSSRNGTRGDKSGSRRFFFPAPQPRQSRKEQNGRWRRRRCSGGGGRRRRPRSAPAPPPRPRGGGGTPRRTACRVRRSSGSRRLLLLSRPPPRADGASPAPPCRRPRSATCRRATDE
jgi:hypothetical protein